MNINNLVKVSLVVCVADDLRIKKLFDSIAEFCEVIVVKNGSTRDLDELINNYEINDRFELKVISIKERNLSKARNIGTINAKYDKVVYYDSDCIIVDKPLIKYFEMLDKYLLVDGKVFFKNNNFQSSVVSVMRSMGLPNSALCPSIGINKKILKKINNYYFDEDIKWIEDGELNIRARKAKIKIGRIEEVTCIHDNLSFKQDLTSAYRYGWGTRIAVIKGLQRKKRPDANWNLIIPCFKQKFFSGIYSLIWNIVYCFGYFLYRGEKNEN